MPKRATTTNSPQIQLDAAAPAPLYRQLYQRLRAAILAGQLEPGARLPSTRTLANQLGVSRNTTALAYDQLLMEGYLESHVGQGTIVSRHLPERQPLPVSQPKGRSHNKAGQPPTQSFPRLANRVTTLQSVFDRTQVRTPGPIFRAGQPDFDLFPYNLWARLISRHARKTLSHFSGYQPAAGYLPLREAIAAHIGITRGVRCTADQIILTCGSQGALDLAVRTLLNMGDAAWIEDPGYFGAQGALASAEVRLIPIPVDEQGLDVAKGRQRGLNARLVSTTPSHQFPTGVTMSLGRRLALLEWAREVNAWILEDDYDSEYRFSGRPLEALHSLDQAGRVLYIGTFSKVLFPALRLGYIVAPTNLVEPLLMTRRYIDTNLPALEQLALTDFMQEGYFARHLRHTLQCYGTRRDLLLAELRTHLSGLLDLYAPEVGMHLIGRLPPDKDDCHAVGLAAQAGLGVAALSSFALEPLPRGGLLFGFAGTSEGDIRLGVRMLAEVLQKL